MHTIQHPDSGQITLAAYIYRRLQSLGIQHIFGCPGDFNLNLLDHLFTIPGLHWIGTCNELNGAYAADGYARIRGIPGVLVTTYGVGELSAINGIAGAYSEHIPIIHIVGTTSRLMQKARTMIHHTLDEDWDHTTFGKMSEPVRAASVSLDNDATFTSDVDWILEQSVKKRRPVYMFVPMDVPDILVEPGRLRTPLDLEIKNEGLSDVEDDIVDEIMNTLKRSSKSSVLVDVLAQRYGVIPEVEKFLRCTGLPAFVTPLAKSHIDETSKSFAGLYNGAITPYKAVKDSLEGSDVIVHIGPLPSDSNTGGWTQNRRSDQIISLHPAKVSVREKIWQGVHFVPVLRKLVKAMQMQGPMFHEMRKPHLAQALNGVLSPSGPLEQHNFWKEFTPYLREDDCVIAEVGSAQYGTLELSLPTGCQFFTQLYYSCIGFTVGALLGALVARREQGKNGRVILFIGDGSLHMKVQELSTIIRAGFHPTIVLINNQGYTIERVIHGPSQRYNDISEPWDYQNMLHFFGAPKSKSYQARTYSELRNIIQNDIFIANEHLQLLECFLDKYDSPWMLTRQVNIVQARSKKELADWDSQWGRKRRVLDTNLFESEYALKESEGYRFVAQEQGAAEGKMEA